MNQAESDDEFTTQNMKRMTLFYQSSSIYRLIFVNLQDLL